LKLRGGITGLDGLNAALSEIGKGEALDKALADTAEEIRRRAVARLSDGTTPDSRTGALAESLTVELAGDGGYIVSTPLDYGWHLEFGGSLRPAAPWLTPATEEAKPGLAERARDNVNDIVAKAARRTR
jgi:hypothetical protein